MSPAFIPYAAKYVFEGRGFLSDYHNGDNHARMPNHIYKISPFGHLMKTNSDGGFYNKHILHLLMDSKISVLSNDPIVFSEYTRTEIKTKEDLIKFLESKDAVRFDYIQYARFDNECRTNIKA